MTAAATSPTPARSSAASNPARSFRPPPTLASPGLAAARARLTDMQAIVGPLIPPERPLKSVAAYKAIVAQFKQAAATGA